MNIDRRLLGVTILVLILAIVSNYVQPTQNCKILHSYNIALCSANN